jgi:thiosulfate/3-mercaptopyruvate sulfurtransferase
MTIGQDPDAKISEYAHPEVLVTTQWVADNLNTPNVVIVESDEDLLLYKTGHIPGAVRIDWHTDLNDPVRRDYLSDEAFAELLSSRGISRGTTVILYGDKSNWWASYTLWAFKLWGHEDVRLMDGGRDKWIAEGRELSTEAPLVQRADYPVIRRDDSVLRAFRDEVLAHLGQPLIDVRSPEEYSGVRTHMPDYPDEGALRAGHIPGAISVPWAKATNEDKSFRSRAELEALYLGENGLTPGEDVIVYCRIGERSSHSWFVLHYLLGLPNVRNYDGSWTEWGSLVGVPIVQGSEPGEYVRR